MARIKRDGQKVSIFAKTVRKSGAKRALVAFKTEGPDGHERLGYGGLTLHDIGRGRSYAPAYRLGMSPCRARVFHDSPENIRALFAQAGLPEPRVVPHNRVGSMFYRGVYALSRGLRVLAPAGG